MVRDLFEIFFKPSISNWQWLNYTTLRQYLPQSNVFFNPWLVPPYINKGTLYFFSYFQYFTLKKTLLILLFRDFYRYSVNWPAVGLWYLKFTSIRFFLGVILESLQWLMYTTLRQYWSKITLVFTPWLVHLYINKRVWQFFSQFIHSKTCLNVEINKLD